MRINQNISAFNAFRNLTTSNATLERSFERLSSGEKINRATDDAAGLVRSEGLRSAISGTKQATVNAQDAVSFLQTTEGALGEVHSVLQRMRTLAIDAANTAGTDGTPQQTELDALRDEILSIEQRTRFANVQVFRDLSADPLVFHIGVGSTTGDELSISRDLRLDPTILAGGGLDAVDLSVDADGAIGVIDLAIEEVSSMRSDLGAATGRLEHVIDNLLVAQENLTASDSRIRDTDMALEMVKMTSSQILSEAGTAMLAQANVMPRTVAQLLQQ
ncbi:MAG: flagellin [Acidimicrobiales bacterium]|nr:flagellin [Acidimicrobiales bacterium]